MTRARELANFADDTAGLETLTVSDITDLTATATELNYTDGVGSAIQTQINAQMPKSGGTFTGNVGIDSSPLATHSDSVSMRFGGLGNIISHKASASSKSLNIANNVQLDTDGSYERIINNQASLYSQYNGTHNFYVAGSDSVGSDITFTVGLNITSSGAVGVGTTSPTQRLDVRNPASSNIGLTFHPIGNDTHTTSNGYWTGSQWERINTSYGVSNWWHDSANDKLTLRMADSGSNPVSFSTIATFQQNGNVDIGGASHSARRFSIKGSANDNSENTIEVLNSDSTTTFKLLSDGNLHIPVGKVGIGATPTSAILTGTTSGSDNSSLFLGATGSGDAEVVLDASNGDFAGADYYILRQMDSTLDVENWLGNSGDYIWRTDQGTQRMRLFSNGKFQLASQQINLLGTGLVNVGGGGSANFSFDIVMDAGNQVGGILFCHHYHYGLTDYGASLIASVGVGNAGFIERVAVDHTTGNGGSWSVSRVNSGTIRVTKNGGTYAGSGNYQIGFIGNR